MPYFFFDADELTARAGGEAPRYREAQPFPHAVIDRLVPTAIAEKVLDEFPKPDNAAWWAHETTAERKLSLSDERAMGPATRMLLAQFNSGAFLRFLERLTGINGLVPDPTYWGGGLHQIRPGGFLKIHADFNRHPVTQLHRRLNLLFYLNQDWAEEYGGHLELWDRKMTACRVRVTPTFNRSVVFDTGRHSFHGHPEPLRCPADRTRKSLATYYYTATAAPGASHAAHTTLFQDPASTAARARRLARRVLPPVVVDAARRLRRS